MVSTLPFIAVSLILVFSTQSIICDDIETSIANIHKYSATPHYDFAKAALDLYLKKYDTSLNDLHSKILTPNKNLDEILNEINTLLHEDLIKIDGDLIKFDYDALINIINQIIQTVIAEKFPYNSLIGKTIEFSIKQYVQQHSNDIKELLGRTTIKIDDLQRIIDLSTSSSSSSRNRRDLSGILDGVKNKVFEVLGELLVKLVRQQVGKLLKPIQVSIDGKLTNLTNYVATFYTPTAPDTPLKVITVTAKNIVVRRGVEMIVLFKTMVDELFVSLSGVQNTTVTSRKFETSEGDGGVEGGAGFHLKNN